MFTICSKMLFNNGRYGDDMEVYIRFLSNPSEWIPLAVLQIDSQIVSTTRHGYHMPYIYELKNGAGNEVHGKITICNFSSTNSIQVRWLVTTSIIKGPPKRVWSLDDVEITLITECGNYALLADSFDMGELK